MHITLSESLTTVQFLNKLNTCDITGWLVSFSRVLLDRGRLAGSPFPVFDVSTRAVRSILPL